MVAITLKLCEIHTELGELYKARLGYEFCVETQEEKVKVKENVDEDTLILWAMSHEAYARFLCQQLPSAEQSAGENKVYFYASKGYSIERSNFAWILKVKLILLI